MVRASPWIAIAVMSTLQCVTAEKQCNNVCAEIYQPVCGSDGKTYSNKCELEYEQCANKPQLSIAYDGECKDSLCEEEIMCTTEYDPVCGSDGNTYGNKCELDRERCKDPKIMVKYLGECREECEKICTTQYEPVCGSDGITYGNVCQLEKAKCSLPSLTVASQGECADGPTGKPEGGDCQKICTEQYTPVCGSDGVTYGNMCKFENAKCKNPKLTVVAEGECGSGSVEGSLEGSGVNCDEVFCTSEYEPVCGSDNTTYSNECEFSKAKCNETSLEIASKGECKEASGQEGNTEDSAVVHSVSLVSVGLALAVSLLSVVAA